MKPVPFMIKVPAFHFNQVEIGQVINSDNGPCKVTKIISVRVIAGELLEVMGMCKDEDNHNM